jgi:hypothetical protein
MWSILILRAKAVWLGDVEATSEAEATVVGAVAVVSADDCQVTTQRFNRGLHRNPLRQATGAGATTTGVSGVTTTGAAGGIATRPSLGVHLS